MAVDQTTFRPQPTLASRAATYGACAISAGLFLSVGWFAMEPDDPMGPVSLFTRQDSLLMLGQAAALAAVVGGLSTLIAGRRLVDIGVFAVAFGFILVSLRGATAANFLIEHAEIQSAPQRALALKFAVEAVGWFAILLAAIAASALVTRWCHGAKQSRDADSPTPMCEADLTAGDDIPWLSIWVGGGPARLRTEFADGWRHTLIATFAGIAALTLLSHGLSDRSIRHGQVCFVVAITVFVGTYVGYRFSPVRSALWPILSVLLMAVLGYLWAAIRSSGTGGPPNLPASQFMRILPIQFISMGVAAALAAFWHLYYPEPEPSPPATRGRHRRGGSE